MESETIYSIHEYTFSSSKKELTHASHETNFAKNTIRRAVRSDPSSTKVFIVFNGCENDEKAYVFEDGNMLIVHSYDAFRAVEMIACWPFNQYSRNSLIEKLTKDGYTKFLGEKDENEYPF